MLLLTSKKNNFLFYLFFFFFRDLLFWRIYTFLGFSNTICKMSACLFVCVKQTFCEECNSKKNPPNFMKFYTKLYPNLNWSLWTLTKIETQLFCYIFPKIFGILGSQLLLHRTTQNFMHGILTIRNNI